VAANSALIEKERAHAVSQNAYSTQCVSLLGLVGLLPDQLQEQYQQAFLAVVNVFINSTITLPDPIDLRKHLSEHETVA
jgi:hypothetical protein